MPSPDLSDRELTVARLLADGRTRADIAEQLHLSRRTVDSHVQNAYRKTGVQTEEQLILWLQDGAVGG
jgi:DNA-binding CsgD family transcriptional regulator